MFCILLQVTKLFMHHPKDSLITVSVYQFNIFKSYTSKTYDKSSLLSYLDCYDLINFKRIST